MECGAGERNEVLTAQLLLDTHVIVRWLTAEKKLSREQERAIQRAFRQREPIAISSVTLPELLRALESNPGFEIAPLTKLIPVIV